jgi:WD40 repeat protein
MFLFSACQTDDGGGYDPNYAKTEAFFPVVDALSSASILRVDPHTMAYVGERTGTSYYLNKVDLDRPGEKVSRNIGGNVAVITASGGDKGKIGLIQAVEHGYEAFAGAYTKIYDADSLALLKTIPLAPPDAEGRIVEPLHHRDPSLSLTDNYAVVLTEDDGFFAGGSAQQYISVYDIAGVKEASHTRAYAGNPGGANGGSNPDLGVGTLMGAVVNGDYIILGGSAGTAVFKIDADEDSLAISKVEGSADTVGNHWFKDNGVYVLESKSNTGTVKVWKWNGGDAPTAVGTVDVNGNNSGSVQALCFDPDNPAAAYFYQKAGTGTGNVYSVDLSGSALTKTTLFSFPNVVIQVLGRGTSDFYQCGLTGLWTIEKQSGGGDTYFAFSGGYSYTPAGGSAVTVGGVLTVKNPPADGSVIGGSYTSSSAAELDSRITEERFAAPYGTAVRTLKTFKNTGGDIYFAAKNYTANGVSYYKLVLEQIN